MVPDRPTFSTLLTIESPVAQWLEGCGFKSHLELGFFPSFQLMLFLSLYIPYGIPVWPKNYIAFHFALQVIQSLSICPRLVGFVMNEGCPIYPHGVESSMVGIDSSHRKSSGERLRVKYIKDTSRI